MKKTDIKNIFYVSYLGVILGCILGCGSSNNTNKNSTSSSLQSSNLSVNGVGNFSSTTGREYNTPYNGGFDVPTYNGQITGPNLVFIEGGTFTMGQTEQNITQDWNNEPRRVSVSSFYMDQTEVRNIDWLEYLRWLDNIYGIDYPEIKRKALPDTLVWRSKLGYFEDKVRYYLRHPAYREYPVVGVNWLQANDYCKWRTDRVNEIILVNQGYLEENIGDINEPFNTEAYLAGQYQLHKAEQITSSNPHKEFRDVAIEDGILLPYYRLPTEAEWEFAAYGLIGNIVENEIIGNKKIYPWTGHFLRSDEDLSRGTMLANFIRGRGDYMGVAGALNDKGDVTVAVNSYPPNDYGLYNMAGNVSEWVLDIYRAGNSKSLDEFRPFRGNVYKTVIKNSEAHISDKHDIVIYELKGLREYFVNFIKVSSKAINSDKRDGTFVNVENTGVPNINQEELNLLKLILNTLDNAITLHNQQKTAEASQLFKDVVDKDVTGSGLRFTDKILSVIGDYIVDVPGTLKYRDVSLEENINRLNYKQSNYINFQDGDVVSSKFYDSDPPFSGSPMYQHGNAINNDLTSLVSNRSRVYKGGSWRDRAYFLNPGARRFLDERQSTATIGFRCAMDRLGTQSF